MPVPPHLQLFQNTGLSDNPILSSLFVLSQMRQDKINQAKAEEQVAIENERADEEFELRKAQLNNQTQQIQQTLEQNNINRRVADFQFRTGSQSVPEAIVAGTIPIPQALDPISSALAQVDRTGNVRPEGTPLGFTEQNPITGEDQFFGPDAISSVIRAEEARQQARVAPQILRMQMDYERYRQQQIDTNQRHQESIQARKDMAAQSAADRKEIVNSQLAVQREIALMRASGDDPTLKMSNLKTLNENNIRPVGVPAVDKDYWSNLSGVDRSILSGTMNASEVFDKDSLAKFTNEAAAAGLVVPNFKKEDVAKYAVQKRQYMALLDIAEKFASSAIPTGGSKFVGSLTEKLARETNHPSVAFLDQMKGLIENLKSLSAQTGVLTDKDVARLDGLIPTYETLSSARQKIEGLRNFLQEKENAFFGAIPPAQRDFMFTANGIPVSSNSSEVKSPEDILNERRGTR